MNHTHSSICRKLGVVACAEKGNSCSTGGSKIVNAKMAKLTRVCVEATGELQLRRSTHRPAVGSMYSLYDFALLRLHMDPVPFLQEPFSPTRSRHTACVRACRLQATTCLAAASSQSTSKRSQAFWKQLVPVVDSETCLGTSSRDRDADAVQMLRLKKSVETPPKPGSLQVNISEVEKEPYLNKIWVVFR